ncbi:MAG: type II toxin-antitoxin system HipA family toxin [Candidatus Algichlamydia australiensis]|nr:type II toxin-antitoxin system HipA family toxin [Chlamydiales bacterium]
MKFKNLSFKSVPLVRVFYAGGKSKILMGRLAWKKNKVFFEYNPEFIKCGLELSPFKLKLQSGVIPSSDFLYEGLFGIFNDSLPDGWGRLLLDRKLIGLGYNPNELTPLDRLSFVGRHGMGALQFEPEHPDGREKVPSNLDKIADEVKLFQEQNDDRYVDDLLRLGGSSMGARPKILMHKGGDDWIVKFRSIVDPIDISSIEYAYHLMAVKAKVPVPIAKLFPSRKTVGYFGVKRFDRERGKPIHMHSIGGLLHADHRVPSLDYEMLMKATHFLTRDVRECKKQFRGAVFNVLSHNRDDHSKNFSFLMDSQGKWSVSPFYDLTFSSGPGGEHSTMVMGEGKNPTRQHLLSLAKVGDINCNEANEIIEEVIAAVLQWTTFADQAKVSRSSAKMIKSAIQSVLQAF